MTVVLLRILYYFVSTVVTYFTYCIFGVDMVNYSVIFGTGKMYKGWNLGCTVKKIKETYIKLYRK